MTRRRKIMNKKLFKSILKESEDREISEMTVTSEDDSLPNSNYYLGLDPGTKVYYNTPSKIYMFYSDNTYHICNDDNCDILAIVSDDDKNRAFKLFRNYIDKSLKGSVYDTDNSERFIKDPSDADEVLDKTWDVFMKTRNGEL